MEVHIYILQCCVKFKKCFKTQPKHRFRWNHERFLRHVLQHFVISWKNVQYFILGKVLFCQTKNYSVNCMKICVSVYILVYD